MSRSISVACVQLSVGPDPHGNLSLTLGLIDQAASAGAQFVLTPEATNALGTLSMENAEQQALQKGAAKPVEPDPHEQALAAKAREHAIWLMAGSLLLPDPQGSGLKVNRQFLWNPQGELVSIYDKIHMFDVSIGDGQTYKESQHYRAGKILCLSHTDSQLAKVKIGHAICYDLRFPPLFAAMAAKGAELMVLPAAFTAKTGAAHWHSLLKARAIENGFFLMAAGQTGEHAGGRQTYGHSMIISPFGEILAEMPKGQPEATGYIIATLDLDQVEKTRNMIPNLKNQKPLCFAKES